MMLVWLLYIANAFTPYFIEISGQSSFVLSMYHVITIACSFIDFDISPADMPCNETYVLIGPAPCVVWCGEHFPRVYTSARSSLYILYVYRESGPALRRGFVLQYFTGLF